MVKRLRWGIAGCGWVARDYVAPAMAASSNGTLAALYDVSADAMSALATRHPDAVTHADLAVFLRDVDAVYVATPNHAHRALVERAAGAGVAVLCEKPMATNLADARAMVAACARAGTAYATAFDQRFHPAHIYLRTMVAGGALGTITAMRIAYCCWVGADFAGDNWRIDPSRAGGGAMIDLAPHGLDLASTLLGERLSQVAAIGQSRVHEYAVDDGAMLTARSRSGVLVQLHVAYNTPEKFERRRLEVVGTRAQVTATNTMGQTAGGTLVLTRAEDGSQTEISVLEAERSPFLNQVEAFAASVLSGTTFPFAPEGDLHVMELLMRAQAQLDGAQRGGAEAAAHAA